MRNRRQPEDLENEPPFSSDDPYIESVMRRLHVIHTGYAPSMDVRSHEILDCLLSGMPYAEIAKSLYISVDTVRSGVRKIYAALECDETTLIKVCRDAGWHRPYPFMRRES